MKGDTLYIYLLIHRGPIPNNIAGGRDGGIGWMIVEGPMTRRSLRTHGPVVYTHVERFPRWPHGNRTQWSHFRWAQGQKSDVGIPPRLYTGDPRYLTCVLPPTACLYESFIETILPSMSSPLPGQVVGCYALFPRSAAILAVSLITGAIRVRPAVLNSNFWQARLENAIRG